MRLRLDRPEPYAYTDIGRCNDQWPDHRARVAVTAALLDWMKPNSVMDPACGGDAAITLRTPWLRFEQTPVYLSDISQFNTDLVRDIILTENLTRWSVRRADVLEAIELSDVDIDVMVLTEIVEHVDDPLWLLSRARNRARRLIVSSPEMRPGQVDKNAEHLWQFDGPGYEEMLNEAGWTSVHKSHLTFRSEYDFQIWVCDQRTE